MPPSPASSGLPDFTGAFVDEGYLQLVQLLGCGGFAKVYKAFDTTSSSDNPVYYAVKCMRNGAPGSIDVAVLSNEFAMHRSVTHLPGVVSFHRVFTDGNDGEFVFMVLDLATGDILDALVKRQVSVNVKGAFVELLDAVEQCHAHGVFHRDLKPGNLLCNSAGTGIQLADFGMATREDESYVFRCGTLAYMSPECADSTRTSYSPHESDLWALAILLLNLVTRTAAWPVAHLSDAKYAAYRADPDNYLVDAFHLTSGANDLFRWCFAADPAARPTLAQIRAAVLNIERFSLADTLPRTSKAPVAQVPTPTSTSSLSSPALVSGLSAPSSSAGPFTPPLLPGAPPSLAIANLLDAANVGLAAVHPPPLIPTKLYIHPSSLRLPFSRR